MVSRMKGSACKGVSNSYDYSFKILLIGDSGVGKSTFLLSFISNSAHDLSPTIVATACETESKILNAFQFEDDASDLVDHLQGYFPPPILFMASSKTGLAGPCKFENNHLAGVDFKIKMLTVGGKRLKLTIWDTAGQERFGMLTSSYYRGADGIVLVYDVTRRETFTNLSDIWAKEVELYSTNPECIKLVVGNKVDRESERTVSREEGMALAREHRCLFLECSAKTKENVQQCFIEIILKIIEAPTLLEKGSVAMKQQILRQKQVYRAPNASGCCS